MKKKILGLLMTFLFIFTVSINNVSAKVLSVNDIYNILEKDKNDTDSIELNDNVITFKSKLSDDIEHIMDFKYEDNKLIYTNVRDVSTMDQELRVTNAMYDNLTCMKLVYSLLEAYDIDDVLSVNIDDFGVIVVEGETVSYEFDDDEGSSKIENTENENISVEEIEFSSSGLIEANEIKSITIDMLKFDEVATKYKSNSVKNDENNIQPTENIQEVVKEDKTTEKNPKTGIEKIGISVILIGLISFITYIIIRNKKVFTK